MLKNEGYSVSQAPIPPGNADDLQFTTVEPSAGPAQASVRGCSACNQPIHTTYYAVGNQLICPRCRDLIAGPQGGSRAGRLFKATVFGLGAGLLGALAWFLVRRLAGLQIGLLAVAVGYMVGRAVRAGSGHRGGRGYQVLAVVLTYCSICANFMPDVFEMIFKHQGSHHVTAPAGSTGKTDSASADEAHDSSATGGSDDTTGPRKNVGIGKALGALVALTILVFVMTLAVPFMGGMSPIGLLIAAFALWEAWKMNARRQLPIAGPYTLTGGMATVGVRS